MAQRHQDDVVFSSGHISGGYGTPKAKHKGKKKASPFGAATTPHAAKAYNLLVQANTFLDTAHSEVYAIEGAMKNLRHALDSFQIHMCADTEYLKVARMKADLMDMLDSIKNTSAVVEGSSTRLQKAINVGKRGVHANQSALQRTQTSRGGHTLEVLDMDHYATSRTWSEKSLTASNSGNSLDAPATPTYTPLTLWETLFPVPGTATLPKDHVAAVLDKLAFQPKPALGKKDVLVFFRELIHWSLVNNHHKMSFLDRSQNKNHSTRYASILTSAAWDELRSQQLLSNDGVAEQRRKFDDFPDDVGDGPPTAAASLTPPQLEAFTTSATFAHMVKTISAKLNFASSPSKSAATCCATPPKDLATTENTLSMAKLLHDLANAECEAKNGFKLSVRTNAVRSKEFSKAFLTASKELLEKETSLY